MGASKELEGTCSIRLRLNENHNVIDLLSAIYFLIFLYDRSLEAFLKINFVTSAFLLYTPTHLTAQHIFKISFLFNFLNILDTISVFYEPCLINKLRVFMQIHIFLNAIKKVKPRYEVASPFKYNNAYYTLDILCFYILYVFCTFLHISISHKCINIHSLMIHISLI